MEKVKLILELFGDYCAFHEMSFTTYTDDEFESDFQEPYEDWDDEDDRTQIVDAIIVDGETYVKLP